MRLLPALLLLGFSCLAVADDEAGLKKEIEAITGKWDVVAVATGGSGTNESVEGAFMHFALDGKTLEFNRGGKKSTAAFKLSPAKNPKEITITLEGSEKSAFGIYKIEAGVLTICHARRDDGERPKEFATTKDEKYVLITLKRAK